MITYMEKRRVVQCTGRSDPKGGSRRKLTHASPDRLETADGAEARFQEWKRVLVLFRGEERGVTMFFLYIVFGLRLVKKVSLSPPRAMLYLAPQYNLLINVGVGWCGVVGVADILHKLYILYIH